MWLFWGVAVGRGSQSHDLEKTLKVVLGSCFTSLWAGTASWFQRGTLRLVLLSASSCPKADQEWDTFHTQVSLLETSLTNCEPSITTFNYMCGLSSMQCVSAGDACSPLFTPLSNSFLNIRYFIFAAIECLLLSLVPVISDICASVF